MFQLLFKRLVITRSLRPAAPPARRTVLAVEPLEGRLVPAFLAPTPYAVPGGATVAAVSDFNGDGKPDLASASQAGGISVLLNDGDGTFGPARTSFGGTSLPAAPLSIATVDFNHDGKLDLILGVQGNTLLTSQLWMLPGNGDGTFAFSGSLTAGYTHSLAVGDLNGDGQPDLVAPNTGLDETKAFGNTVTVFFNVGGLGFSQSNSVHMAVGNEPTSVTLADMNRDGRLDILTTNYRDGTVSELLGNGDGTFQGLRNFGVGSHPVAVRADDFSGDGIPDILAALDGGSLIVLTGKGDGSFNGGKAFAVNTGFNLNPNSLAVGDFNGDGKLDVAVLNPLSGTTSVLLGNGNATFRTAVQVAGSGFVAASDLNGDGLPDLVTQDSSQAGLLVLLNDGRWNGL